MGLELEAMLVLCQVPPDYSKILKVTAEVFFFFRYWMRVCQRYKGCVLLQRGPLRQPDSDSFLRRNLLHASCLVFPFLDHQGPN